MRQPRFLALVVTATILAACSSMDDGPPPLHLAPDVDVRLEQFAPVEIGADLEVLSEQERDVLIELIAASRPLSEIFREQAWRGNPALRGRLAGSTQPEAAAALTYFDLMVGPWDRLDEEAFVGSAARPEGAGYYPEDMSAEEFRAWVAAHPEERESFESLFTIIDRGEDGLVAIPYSQRWRTELERSATRLRRAAELTDNASLRRFLLSRASAFMSDDYYQSDKDWMDLESVVEVTIGPYEVYEDRLFGYKAAFESFVTVTAPELSRQLSVYKDELPAMEMNLPIPDEIKNRQRGTESPIRVADLVFSAGDTRAGVQTIAFNLPNDERVREEKGSKKVILRNVLNAKFKKIMQPIALRILDPSHHGDLAAEAFFNETLFHELSHGLGPGKLVLNGRPTEVRKELQEIYSASEECKADACGAWNVLLMIDEGYFPPEFRRTLLVTYFAGLFRSVRFGVAEAHGRGAAVQINYYLTNGAARREPASGRLLVDPVRLEQCIGDLLREVLVLQAAGDKAGTDALFERYGRITPEIEAILATLTDIPVDIRPIYVSAGEQPGR